MTDNELNDIAEKCLLNIVLYCYHYHQSSELKKFGINSLYSVVDKEALLFIKQALREVDTLMSSEKEKL